jgi:hypothetical protein
LHCSWQPASRRLFQPKLLLHLLHLLPRSNPRLLPSLLRLLNLLPPPNLLRLLARQS